jgi:helicase MOV-10
MTAGFPWPDVTAPLVFVDVPQGRETSTSEKTSYSNSLEAEVVLEVVRGLLAEGEVDASEIGVISPYRGQVRDAVHIYVLRASF